MWEKDLPAEQSLKILFLLFFAAAGLLLNFIIPPFQNPDEPHHFGTIMIYALGEDKKDFVEKEILRLMDKNDWWKFAGMGRPEPLPSQLSEIPYLMGYYPISDFRKRLENMAFYHFLLGRALALTGIENVGLAYYCCRLVSFLFILASLVLAWFAFRKIAAKWSHFFFAAPFFILLLPQYAVLSISVNSDAAAVFLGSLFFYSAFSLIGEKFRAGHLIVLWGSAFLGLITDRSVFSLIFLAVFSLLFCLKINKKNYQNYIVGTIAFFLVFILAANFLVTLFPLEIDNSARLISQNWQRTVREIPRIFSLAPFNLQFYSLLTDSFLLKFGWMAFSPGKIFYWIWRGLIALAGLGMLVYVIRYFVRWISGMSRKKQNTISLVIFSAVAVFGQLAGLWGYYGANKILPQGRHLFPMIIPIVFLFLIGIDSLFSTFHKKAGRTAICVLTVGEFLFLSYAIWNYVIPVFHLTVKGPHPGI